MSTYHLKVIHSFFAGTCSRSSYNWRHVNRQNVLLSEPILDGNKIRLTHIYIRCIPGVSDVYMPGVSDVYIHQHAITYINIHQTTFVVTFSADDIIHNRYTNMFVVASTCLVAPHQCRHMLLSHNAQLSYRCGS